MTIKDQVAPILSISLSSIVPSKTNPRKTFPPEKLQEMADSIEAHGILQPILVRTPRDGKYEIVAGETRWRAAGLTSLTEAPCLVRELSDFEALEIQVLENLHRNDLTPMEEARGFKQLLDKSQDIAAYTIDQLADKIGKSRTYMYDSLKLLELPDAAVNALNNGELNRSTALLVARLTPDVQTSALTKISEATVDGQTISYRDAKSLIKAEVEASELNIALNNMIHAAIAQGKAVVDLRDKTLKDAWAKWGVHNAHWEHKEGWLAGQSAITSTCKSMRVTVDTVLEGQDTPLETVHLVGVEYTVPKMVAMYPEAAIQSMLDSAIATGRLSAKKAEPSAPSAYEIKRARLDAETQSRRCYVSDLIERIIGSPKVVHLTIAMKTLVQVICGDIPDTRTDYTLMGMLDIADQEAMANEVRNCGDANTLTQLSLCHFIASNTSAPYYLFDDDFDPETDGKGWSRVLEIAQLYNFPPYISEASENLSAPPAAAQAQEVIAPEKPDPAIEAAGELSEDEAKLTTGEPAAPARDKSQDTFISRTAAQARMDDIKAKSLARKARKESAKADVSKAAPIAAATGETSRNEVTA